MGNVEEGLEFDGKVLDSDESVVEKRWEIGWNVVGVWWKWCRSLLRVWWEGGVKFVGGW